ncbi:MAG: hypothetical protein HWE30_07635 [Methylocystaceae bacterium]|nr:hypothetical protein [Methylocystaceae bacterium]
MVIGKKAVAASIFKVIIPFVILDTSGCGPGERDLTLKAKQALSDYVNGGPIILKNITTGKYAGRVLAVAHTPQGQNIAQLLIHKGLGRPY